MIYLGWGNSTHTSSAQVYNWREELKEQARCHDMGSGASAVLVRRQLAAHATASSSPPDTPVTDAGRKRPHAAVEKGAPSADGVGQSVVVAAPGLEQDGGDGEGADTGDCASSASALDESEGVMEAAQSAAASLRRRANSK